MMAIRQLLQGSGKVEEQMIKYGKRLFILSLFIVLMGACVAGDNATGDNATGDVTGGKKAPAFELRDLNGNIVRLADFKGKVVLVDFWATWCGPCRKIIPDLVRLHTNYHTKGLEIIGLSLDRQPEKVLPSFIQQNKISYPIAAASQRLAAEFGGVKYIPTLFVVDKNGTIVGQHVGGTDYDSLVKMVEKLL
ncbi:redoxin domain-containing protein [bacterium]|nr:redoxin domain-containing protein [candidate division CSSED10-310 bacterium]